MCGRFTITDPNEAIAALFAAVIGNDLPDSPRYNICPTDQIAVVTSDASPASRRLRTMRWGLLPGWYKTPTDGPLIINARADTVAVKPAFREAVRSRRCLIPAAGFYEWSAGPDGTRMPWYITRTDGAPMVFGGLWQPWGEMLTCAMVTVDAGPGMAGIHHREPLIIAPADWSLWLGEAGHGAATLMKPTAAGLLKAQRVATAVNSNRATGSDLIAPISA
jgi:putative SOS response-associated peptidase YedK